MVNTRRRGDLGETVAAAFLQLKGCEVMGRNYRFARREIDLVVRDGNHIVAVEVKLRRGSRYGTAAQAIDKKKLDRIRLALDGMVRDGRIQLKPRIDVVAIDVQDDGARMTVEHIAGVY